MRPDEPTTLPHEETWRVGRKVGRTIYREGGGDGVLIGMLDTREDARLAAAAPEMARMLLELEWNAGERDECPECGGTKGIGHASTAPKRTAGAATWPDPAVPCALDALLRKASVR